MTLHKLLMLASVSTALCLSACAHTTSPFDEGSAVNRAWGHSVDVAHADQMANPDAPTTDAAPEGIDAPAAAQVADRYYRGHKVQPIRVPRAVVISGD